MCVPKNVQICSQNPIKLFWNFIYLYLFEGKKKYMFFFLNALGHYQYIAQWSILNISSYECITYVNNFSGLNQRECNKEASLFIELSAKELFKFLHIYCFQVIYCWILHKYTLGVVCASLHWHSSKFYIIFLSFFENMYSWLLSDMAFTLIFFIVSLLR